MGMERMPEPVKLFIGILYEDSSIFKSAIDMLSSRFGDVEDMSKEFDFDYTDYYRDIGKHLKRVFISFVRLIEPSELAVIKRFTNMVEQTASGGKRRINLDPGYIDGAKLVLASTKDYSHRVYLSGGIYAEVTMRYARGEYVFFDYTYPDYRRRESIEFFLKVRERFLAQRRGEYNFKMGSITPSVLNIEEAMYVSEMLKNEGKIIVMTNGCFDILHRGHLYFLKKSRELGDVLVVGLNSDSSVRSIKGEGRPVVPQESRSQLLVSLRFVDYVVIFDEPTAERVASLVRPAIYVKGDEYEGKSIPEERVVKKYGGRVVYLKMLPGWSTTSIIQKAGGVLS